MMTGAAAGSWMMVVGVGSGVTSWPPACKLSVKVIVPATVPVENGTSGETVVPAGMVICAVRPPVEKLDGRIIHAPNRGLEREGDRDGEIKRIRFR